jgi:hypothetical protein
LSGGTEENHEKSSVMIAILWVEILIQSLSVNHSTTMFGPMGIVAALYERVNWLAQEAVHLRGSACEEIYLHCPTEITAE